MDKKIFFIILLGALFVVSLAGNVFLGYVVLKDQSVLRQQNVNRNVLDFRNMFTEYVLLSGKEIDFDTRLTMETAVRGLNDPEIFSQWQKFTESTTKEEATAEAKKLLSLLIQKSSN
ncbi:MAG: hypothetical protein A2358_03625 [Candidatus Staskawiczbacteria bacterium RIFOXYB1_FULL_37_44]|uniref:Uncharacterized protein n=1 Tax=Candidatus Staskawiczbacteria bacterium RIFOXYB1_FULL_37_44 TaxID=1802223 RepID=A0A1G2IXE5_9BACT|nr:MAG: hypothetical protein A2358_03625 [Candidatus Staskawiczbacteria bacterium RIFOXYB1_FULL_37_44]OGZ84369.1 MAG: hypothetical protein A2416_01795 [Candidatus Staskawiczbacteria bacterium RIFOXYC1_FULL_37_52]OGZ87419.1 MAG: hypothetical protein A2444_03860 [Candidatus Staskawiczbacteria bacterium RIFOXYC2_FULL_37_19]OGZ89801.1 MAG: hypothetical protein A2581_00965 [Candidatus Staskawiczbacteria bacterium RIFOXYD1_FULL_37_110]